MIQAGFITFFSVAAVGAFLFGSDNTEGVLTSIRESGMDFLFLFMVTLLGYIFLRSMCKEIRNRKKLEKLSLELAEANIELEKLDQAKSEFVSIASHQLRTPLTVIRGYISMALEGSLGTLSLAGKDAFMKVSFEIDQLIKLMNSLLDLSRIESGKIKYDFAEGDLTKLIEGIIKEFQPMLDKKEIKVVFENNVFNLPKMVFDPDKIREVLVNLLDNAIKYTPEGKVKIILEIINKGGVDVVRISIADNGIGIKAEDLSKLFVKFGRTQESQTLSPGGMGIGLYFVKRVVEDHGGRAWVESGGAGEGSTFFVELPPHKEKRKS